jgi:ADP-ribose pyrophosphatase YjhB (NUDIX family)
MPGPRIRNSAKAVVVHQNAVLLIDAVVGGTPCYLLPGGGQRPGESLAEAARREVLEETGLRVSVGPLLWVNEWIGRNHTADEHLSMVHRVEVTFRCTLLGGPITLEGDNPDMAQTGVAWVPLDVVQDAPLLVRGLRNHLAELDRVPGGGEYLGDLE